LSIVTTVKTVSSLSAKSTALVTATALAARATLTAATAEAAVATSKYHGSFGRNRTLVGNTMALGIATTASDAGCDPLTNLISHI
jgi:hypothetical protein